MTALLLAVPLVLTAPVPKETLKGQLDGAWRPTGLTFDGKPINGEKGDWVFAGDTVTFHVPDGRAPRGGTIKTDPKASPKRFEFADGGMLGVYDVAGDTLVICLSQVGVRPTDTKGGPDILRYAFSRVKDK
jgi:uncharacterized protein (TIGR03067 family)